MYSQVALNPSPPASASTVLGLYTYHHTHCNSLKIITCVMYRVCMCTLMGPCVYHSVHVESEGNFQESALYHVGPRSQSQLVGPGGRRPQVLPAVSAQQLVCSGGLHASCVSTPQHESGPSCDTHFTEGESEGDLCPRGHPVPQSSFPGSAAGLAVLSTSPGMLAILQMGSLLSLTGPAGFSQPTV